MLEYIQIPIIPIENIKSLFYLFFAFLIGHSFGDYPLQGYFLSIGKTPYNNLRKKNYNFKKYTWIYLMSTHCLIHSGIVWIISGNIIIAFLEFILHWVIDYLKCKKVISFYTDQNLHVLCKVIYIIILFYLHK